MLPTSNRNRGGTPRLALGQCTMPCRCIDRSWSSWSTDCHSSSWMCLYVASHVEPSSLIIVLSFLLFVCCDLSEPSGRVGFLHFSMCRPSAPSQIRSKRTCSVDIFGFIVRNTLSICFQRRFSWGLGGHVWVFPKIRVMVNPY